MTDQPNLQQFLDQMSSYSDEMQRSGGRLVGRQSAIPPIGHVVEIAGSGIARHDGRRPPAPRCMTIADPSIAMSGQVGSQIKMKVGVELADRQRPHPARRR